MNDAIALLFLLGPIGVVPALLMRLPQLGHPGATRLARTAARLALPAGIVLAAAFTQPPGVVAGAMALPWTLVGAATALAAAIDAWAALASGRALRPGVHHATWAALVFLAVAGGNAQADRLGVQPFGFPPTIVLLTAVHFTFAGFVLVLHGVLVWRRRPGRALEVALGAVVVGIPVTALGFFGIPIAAWIGALLVAGGGIGIGLGTIASAAGPSRPATWLARLAGATLLATMPLAAIYATGVFTGAGWLTIPVMAATHGVGNVLGFAVPAALAWGLDRQAHRP